jgi:VanZ family protein
MPPFDRYALPILKSGFALAVALVLICALYPLVGEGGGNGDKILHFAAFYALALLGAAAFPSRKALVWLAVLLCAYGALIEILQPLPPFGRDRDVLDWVADTIGITLAILPLMVARWRDRFRPQ